jgi:hypothetical protein
MWNLAQATRLGVLPPSRLTLTPIPGGDKGTKATLIRMKEIVWKSVRHPEHGPVIREAAIATILKAGVRPKDFLGEYKAIHDFVRDDIRWTRDARKHETLVWPARTLMIGGGDAFQKDTKVILRRKLDNTYRVKRLGELEGSFAEYDALSYNYGISSFEFKPIVAWYDKGVKETYKLRTKNARELRVSSQHLMDYFLASGKSPGKREARANEIFSSFTDKRAPRLPFALKIPELGSVDATTSDRLFIEGMYLAEGWYEKNHRNHERVSIGIKDPVLFSFLTDAMGRIGVPYYVTHQSNGVKVMRTSNHAFREEILRKFGRGSFEKTIPEDYLSKTRSELEALIDGYALGDAYKPKDEHAWAKYANLIHNTSSSHLARMLCLVHLVMGRTLHPYLQMNHMGAGHSPIWRLIERKNIRGYKPVSTDLAPAPLKKFEEAGEAECCDITVLDNHNVVTEEGLVQHNCDDKTMLEGAMLLMVGFPGVGARAIAANPEVPEQYTHVYVVAKPTERSPWIASDPTVSGAKLGWQSPVIFKKMDLEF